MVFKKGYKSTKKYDINKEDLVREYWDNKKSSRDIAKQYGISTSTIVVRMKEHNIPTRNISERKKLALKRDGHPMKGKHHSKETKQKLRLINLGKKHSQETIKKIGESSKKIKHTKEWNEKVSKAQKGKPKTEENLKGLKEYAHSNKGKTYEEIHGKEKSKEIKSKISIKTRLENNPRWLGGIAFEPYTPNFNINFKNEVRKRDNQVCMLCGINREKINRSLNVHHIDYDKKLSIPQNCLCLCDYCHTKTNSNRTPWTKFFQSLLSERYGYQYSSEGITIINLNNGVKI